MAYTDMEKLKANKRRFYMCHRDRIRQERKRWRKEHPERAEQLRRASYLRNREAIISSAKEWRKRNPEKAAAIIKAKAKREPERRRARGALKKAVYDGRIAKPTVCSLCNTNKKERRFIHGHHSDYDRPFAVTWVCARCHPSLHGF